MKRSLFFVLLLIISLAGRSQNPNLDFRGAIKISNTFTYIDFNGKQDSLLDDYIYHNNSWQFFHPTFAFMWKAKNGNIQEVELQDVQVASNFMLSVSAKYDYYLTFYKSNNWKLVPSLGLGVNPYYFQYNNGDNDDTDVFFTDSKYFGMRIFITPKLTYYLGSKVFFDLDLPLCAMDTYYKIYRNEDPGLTIPEQKTTSFDFGPAFPYSVSIKIGVGVKF
jgi:hypothetical protein